MHVILKERENVREGGRKGEERAEIEERNKHPKLLE